MKLLYIFFLCLLDSVGRTHLRSRDLLLLRALVDERLVDVRDHAAASNGGLDERVELLVTADGELEVAGRDALDLWVSGSRGRRRRSERVVVVVFRREKETDRKNVFRTT